MTSTGVTGFTASWVAGTLSNGAGSITINITGSSTTDGEASFPITIAGQSCTITLGSCGAFVAPGVWKTFLCHNLGANTSLDPHTPVVGLIGASISWGKRGPNTTGDSRVDWQTAANSGPLNFAAAPTASNPNYAGVPLPDWNTTVPTAEAWRTTTGAKTANDPCPAGFRVPTRAEWEGVLANNTQTYISSTHIPSATNYGSAIRYGTALTLPSNGDATYQPAPMTMGNNQRGARGFYWSSSNTLPENNSLQQVHGSGNSGGAIMNWRSENALNNIRCIAE